MTGSQGDRENATLTWFISGHLVSTSLTVDAGGNMVSSVKYTAFSFSLAASECSGGKVRSTSGVNGIDYRYTGQREETEIGLYFYKARFYDPALARFVQADTIIPEPGNPQSWDRYAYVNNSPVRYSDPSGHWVFEDTPNDPYYVPAHSGINPFRRYVTAGVTQGEASKIFVKTMSDPGNDIVNWFGFGGKNTLGGPGYHPGIDFHSTLNDKKGTSILSVLSGRVVEVTKDRSKDFGLHVVVEHDIYGVSLYSVYAHLEETSVIENQLVPIGKKLGGMGNTPFENGVIHLHFEVRTEHNVKLDDQSNYLTLNRSADAYWFDSLVELYEKWVDLGPRYGYSSEFPWTN